MSVAFMLILFVSMMFSSLPLVKATIYPDGYPDFDFPPDYHLEGDINHNGEVDIYDVVFVTSRYGLHEGDEGWNPLADLNDDGVIDIYDVTIVTSNYGQGEPLPVAYSTSFEFTVPDDGDTEVCYYLQIEFYIPTELDGKYFWCSGSVDDSFGIIKVDGCEEGSGGSGSFNGPLDYFSEGFHLLEIEHIESTGAGHVNFELTTSSEEKAWLVRFRIHVANYSDAEYRYTLTTHTNFPVDDDYFLNGYANDYIDDVYVDGLKWQDWEWDTGEYGAIYAWGDGFCYPLGERVGWRDVTFTFGEIWGGGLLDFRYIAWTDQREYWLTAPKFCAIGSLNQADYITMNSAMFYGGSKWKIADDPQFSERYFEARQVINASYNDGSTWFDACLEIGLGLGWAEWALLPATEDDVGISLNFTATHFATNRRDHMDMGFWFELDLEDPTIDIYSFSALEIDGIEYEEHDSFVKPDLTSAIDYTGTVIMFVSSTIVGGAPGLLGATVGLGIKGLAAAIRITEGQPVSRFEQNITDAHHYQILRNYDLSKSSPPQGEIRATSDIIFFKLNPVAGKHCGLTKVVLHGTLVAEQWFIGGPGTGPLIVWSAPIADIEISIYIPWFLRG